MLGMAGGDGRETMTIINAWGPSCQCPGDDSAFCSHSETKCHAVIDVHVGPYVIPILCTRKEDHIGKHVACLECPDGTIMHNVAVWDDIDSVVKISVVNSLKEQEHTAVLQ